MAPVTVSYYRNPTTYTDHNDPVNTVYRSLIRDILTDGQSLFTRNANRTRLHNVMIQFDTFPLVTVRRTAWKTALREMEGFLAGYKNVNQFHESVKKWWEQQTKANGHMPYSYGHQFRNAACHPNTEEYGEPFDQIEYLVNGVKEHPFSTRNLITTWNTGDMAQPDCIVTNCHGTVLQVFGRKEPDDQGPIPDFALNDGIPIHNPEKTVIDMTMYQRSADLILGVPHNWVQYWAFMQWLAHRTGTVAGSFTWIGGDVHVYESHLEVARKIKSVDYYNPIIHPRLTYAPSSAEFKADDFTVDGKYEPAVTDEVRMVV